MTKSPAAIDSAKVEDTGEPWQVGDDTSSVQISRDGSTHKWGCKCDGCVPTTGSEPDWKDKCAALVDIYDDARNNAPEDRCYVDGAFTEEMNEVRAALLAASMGGDKS